jgi:hypothetical protein
LRGLAKRTAAASLLFTLACTVYTPIHGVEAVPGYDVRVTLTDNGAVDIAPKIGPRARQLEGTLKQMTDSSLLISVRRISREGGGDDTYDGNEIALGRRDIESVEKSGTSVSRSILVAGAVIASVFLIAKGAGDFSGGRTGGPPPPTR